jgi:hypothetical protein
MKSEMKKIAKPSSQIQINLPIAHELSSHLVSQAYLFYSFAPHNIYMWHALYGAFWESLVLSRFYK